MSTEYLGPQGFDAARGLYVCNDFIGLSGRCLFVFDLCGLFVKPLVSQFNGRCALPWNESDSHTDFSL